MFDALASSLRSTGTGTGGEEENYEADAGAGPPPQQPRSILRPAHARRRRSSRMFEAFKGVAFGGGLADTSTDEASGLGTESNEVPNNAGGDNTAAGPRAAPAPAPGGALRRRQSRLGQMKKRKSRHVNFGEEVVVDVHIVERKRASLVGSLFYSARDILQFKDDKFEEEAEEQRLEKERQKAAKKAERDAKKADRKAKLAARRAKRGAVSKSDTLKEEGENKEEEEIGKDNETAGVSKEPEPPPATREASLHVTEEPSMELSLDPRPSIVGTTFLPHNMHLDPSSEELSHEIKIDMAKRDRRSLFETMEDSLTLEQKRKQLLSNKVKEMIDNTSHTKLDLSLMNENELKRQLPQDAAVTTTTPADLRENKYVPKEAGVAPESALPAEKEEEEKEKEEAKKDEEEDHPMTFSDTGNFEDKLQPKSATTTTKSIAALEEQAQLAARPTNSLQMTDDSENDKFSNEKTPFASSIEEQQRPSQSSLNGNEDFYSAEMFLSTELQPSLLKSGDDNTTEGIVEDDSVNDLFLQNQPYSGKEEQQQQQPTLTATTKPESTDAVIAAATTQPMPTTTKTAADEPKAPDSPQSQHTGSSLSATTTPPPQPPVELELPPSPETEKKKEQSSAKIKASWSFGSWMSDDSQEPKRIRTAAKKKDKKDKKDKKNRRSTSSLGKAFSKLKKLGKSKKKKDKSHKKDESNRDDATGEAATKGYDWAHHDDCDINQGEGGAVKQDSIRSQNSNGSSGGMSSNASTLTDYNASVRSSNSSTGSFMAYDWGQQQYQKRQSSKAALQLPAVPEIASEDRSESEPREEESSSNNQHQHRINHNHHKSGGGNNNGNHHQYQHQRHDDEEISEATRSLIEELERPRRASSLLDLMKKFMWERQKELKGEKKKKKKHKRNKRHGDDSLIGMSVSASSSCDNERSEASEDASANERAGNPSYYDWQVHEDLKTQPRERTGSYLGRMIGRSSSTTTKRRARKRTEEEQNRREKFLAGQRAEQHGCLYDGSALKASTSNGAAFTGPLHALVEMES